MIRTASTLLMTGLASVAIEALDVEHTDDRLSVTFDNSVELTFTLDGEHLLGLTTANVNGVATTG